ncbi:MAG: ECF-type sigma factor [Phycisphaerales bacterium]
MASAIYHDLRRIAASHLRGERRDHTLQPTALVNEAYLRLVGQHSTDWKDRVHFFAVASLVIRRVLVDHARERAAAKRGAGMARVPLDDADVACSAPDVDIVDLDDALTRLAELDARQARIVELRFFGGLTIDEVAGVLEVAGRTVDREWQCARGWLYAQLSDAPGRDGDG